MQGLIERISRSDQSALEQFYDATKNLVYSLALRILRDATVAEDVTLEVFMQVWRQAHLYDLNRGRPSAWILTMTRSRAIDRLRLRPKEEVSRDPVTFTEQEPDPAADPERTTIISERCAKVQAAFATLSADQRVAIELAYYSGLSQSEIAEKLGQPLGTVKSRIRSAMISLKNILVDVEVAYD